jgi:Kdo2-lipid IVA lauroyltransferase/acyltransferase
MSSLLTRVGLGFLWLLHWLPLPVMALVGDAFGRLLYRALSKRRKITLTNLRLCFPGLDTTARERLAKAHFSILTRSLLERGLLWWASEERLRRLIRLDGEEHLDRLQAEGRPILILAPHFVGLDAAGMRMSMTREMVTIYAKQSNPLIERVLLKGRSRFCSPLVLAKQEGIRAILKALRSGRPFYYLPDMDYGARDAVFVPFFGIQAATITGLSRLTKMSGAAVVPVTTQILPGGRGYVVRIEPPWEGYPSDDVTADTRRMNEWLETAVRRMPEQYYWVHKRFKTRPAGEPSLY